MPLPEKFSIGATLGYQIIDDEAAFGTPDYLTWSVTLSRPLFGFDLALSYVDTDEGSCGNGCDATVLFFRFAQFLKETGARMADHIRHPRLFDSNQLDVEATISRS